MEAIIGTRPPESIINVIGRRIDLTRETRGYIRRRIAERIARFHGIVRSVDVRITDINGPRGGFDKSCSVVATLDSGESLIARTRATTVQGALARATRILGRRISNSLKRNRWQRRKG